MEGVTIKAISPKTREIISEMLNPIMPLSTSDEGLSRDWRGLFELCGIEDKFMAGISQHMDPTMKVLRLWNEKDGNGSTIDVFLSYLQQIDRYDVVYDITSLIEKDVEAYKREEHDLFEPTFEIFTIDDLTRFNQGLEPQNYDAFVLFADDDINFATELIEIMEKQYNLKLCTKDRDVIASGDEHEVMIKLIKQRCNKLIVILSPAFMESPSHRFFLRFGQGMAFELKQDKVVPCVCKRFAELPAELVGYFMLDYTRSGTTMWNFWERLYNALKLPAKISRSVSNPNKKVVHQRAVKQVRDNDKDMLKPIGQAVKCSSLVNLNSLSEREKLTQDQGLSTSPSVHSLTVCPEKKKSRPKFLKKFFPKHIIKSSNNNMVNNSNKQQQQPSETQDKDKKKCWSLHTKRVAIAN